MKEELFAISEYCIVHDVDPSFIHSLESEGLITVTFSNNERFIREEELQQLEIFTRWYHDLGINVEGIDVIRNLLHKLREVQSEITDLKNKLQHYEHPG